MQYLRDNAGVLEASANGTTWEAVVLGTGGGGVTDHTLLTNIGTNTHAQLDEHLADSGLHGADLMNPVALGNLDLRENSGALEVSNDAGATWQAVALGEAGQTVEAVTVENKTLSLSEIDGRLVLLFSGYDAILPAIASETGYLLITFNARSSNSKVFPDASDYISLISGGGSAGQGIDLTAGTTIQLCGHNGEWFEVLTIGTVTLIV